MTSRFFFSRWRPILSTVLVGWSGGLLLASGAGAQVLPDSATPDSLDHYYIDFSVPDLAAFTLLGIEGSQISRPGNVRELSVALNNSLSALGDPEQGIGVEVALPRLLARPRTLRDYRGLRDRFTLSFGTIRVHDATRFGAGFRWVPIDGADPYEDDGLQADLRKYLREALDEGVNAEERSGFLNYISDGLGPTDLSRDVMRGVRGVFEPKAAALRQLPDVFTTEDARARLAPLLDSLGIVPTSEQEGALRDVADRYVTLVRLAKSVDVWAVLEERIVERKKAFRDSTWNAFSLQFAAGITARATTVDDIRAEAFSAFSGVTFPLFDLPGQLILHGQIHLPFDDEDPLTSYDDGLRASIGGQLLYGSATKRFSFEALYGTNDPRLEGEGHGRFTVGVEFRISEGVYLELATGLDDPASGAARFLTLGSLRYALRQDRRFPTP